MTSTHFLLGQQMCGYHKGKGELTFLEQLLCTRHQAHSDTSICPLLTHHVIQYSDPCLRNRKLRLREMRWLA